jgi:hypothetical protein
MAKDLVGCDGGRSRVRNQSNFRRIRRLAATAQQSTCAGCPAGRIHSRFNPRMATACLISAGRSCRIGAVRSQSREVMYANTLTSYSIDRQGARSRRHSQGFGSRKRMQRNDRRFAVVERRRRRAKRNRHGYRERHRRRGERRRDCWHWTWNWNWNRRDRWRDGRCWWDGRCWRRADALHGPDGARRSLAVTTADAF